MRLPRLDLQFVIVYLNAAGNEADRPAIFLGQQDVCAIIQQGVIARAIHLVPGPATGA